jgi:hypothetical protein
MNINQNVMKKAIIFFPAIFLILFACTKKESARTSGTDTIENTTYFSTTYYLYGFSFSQGKLLSTNLNPGPDITLYVTVENGNARLTLQTNNFSPSFYKVGEYNDEPSAKAAFDNLKTVTADQWIGMADPIKENQVWIYKSGTETYTKFRIISTVNETRSNVPYGECTFQWVYQPDGSTTFPQ